MAKSKWTHSELCDKTAKYLQTTGDGHIVAIELHSELKEIPDVYAVYRHFTIMCEIKASRSDFRKDKRKSFRIRPSEGVGTYRYYVCPENLIKVEDLPPKWGLIWVFEDGSVRMIKGKAFKHKRNDNAHTFQANYRLEYKAMYSLLRRAASWGMGADGHWNYDEIDADIDDLDALNKLNAAVSDDFYVAKADDDDFYVNLEEEEDDMWQEIQIEEEDKENNNA